jgi:hypothetical protein
MTCDYCGKEDDTVMEVEVEYEHDQVFLEPICLACRTCPRCMGVKRPREKKCGACLGAEYDVAAENAADERRGR